MIVFTWATGGFLDVCAKFQLIFLEEVPWPFHVFISRSKLYFMQDWGYKDCGFLWYVLGRIPIQGDEWT